MITKITTRGYSGPGTQFQYMPPGELTVADETSVGQMTVTEELADYLVGIGIAQVIEDILEAHWDGGGEPILGSANIQENVLDFEAADLVAEDRQIVASDNELLITDNFNSPDGGTWTHVNFQNASRADLIEYALKADIDLPPGYLTKDKLIALITATNE